MISKRAIDVFLNRALDNHDFMKSMSEREVDGLLADLIPPVHFTTPPRLHQKVCFLLGCVFDQFLFLTEMGTGKTKVSLDLIDYSQWDCNKRALVLVPGLAGIETWVMEAQKHGFKLKVERVLGGASTRMRMLAESNADVLVINYDGLTSLMTTYDKVEKERRLDFDALAVRERFGIIVFDEIHRCKNHQSWRYKVCSAFAASIKQRYGLTGTPANRSPHDLWAQFKMIDGGATLGNTLSIFRGAFFTETINRWGAREYTIAPRRMRLLSETIKHRSIAYRTDECVALPELVQTEIPVRMEHEQRRYYFAVIDKLKDAKGDFSKVKNAFMSLRQIVSGFVRTPDEQRDMIVFKENPRLDALADLLDEVPPDRKVVVFHEFIWSGQRIAELMGEMGIVYESLWSGTKDKPGAIRRFMEDPKVQAFVVNSKSGSETLNLQVANYHIFYETPVSAIDRAQAQRRTYRPGQDRTVFMYDIVVVPGPDRKILSYVQEGKDLLRALMRGEEDFE